MNYLYIIYVKNFIYSDLRNNTIKSIPDRSFKLINTENL